MGAGLIRQYLAQARVLSLKQALQEIVVAILLLLQEFVKAFVLALQRSLEARREVVEGVGMGMLEACEGIGDGAADGLSDDVVEDAHDGGDQRPDLVLVGGRARGLRRGGSLLRR